MEDMHIMRIYLYEDDEDPVLVISSSGVEAQRIKDATAEFSRLDRIYGSRNDEHSDFETAVEVVETGFSAFLKKQGFKLPAVEDISL